MHGLGQGVERKHSVLGRACGKHSATETLGGETEAYRDDCDPEGGWRLEGDPMSTPGCLGEAINELTGGQHLPVWLVGGGCDSLKKEKEAENWHL